MGVERKKPNPPPLERLALLKLGQMLIRRAEYQVEAKEKSDYPRQETSRSESHSHVNEAGQVES